MKTITINEKDYQIPTCWNDVTIRAYQRIYKQINEITADDTDDVFELIERQINLISAYTGIPVEELNTSKTDDVLEIVNILSFLFDEPESKQIVEFEHNNVKYNVMQTLINQQFQDYISLENLLQQENLIDVLHLIVAVLSRASDTESLSDYDVHLRAEEFKDLPFPIANNISVFFYHFVKNLEQTFQLYSNPEALVEMLTEEAISSMKNSDGKGLLTKLQIGIIQKYLKYMKREWMKSLRSIQESS